jgi:hypothetical protein
MANLLQFRQNLAKISNRKDVYEEVFRAIKFLETYLLDLQKEQLSAGVDNEGVEIGTYSRLTETIARQSNPIKPKRAGDPYNFEWTGGFFQGMRLDVGKQEAVFTSSDSKTPMLTVKYPGLLGLTQDHLNQALEDRIIPEFLKAWKEKLL